MKTKCPVCASCFDYVWVGNRRFFECFLCQTMYDLPGDGTVRKIKTVEIAKDLNGNDTVQKVIYEDAKP
jgi:hypothetical protein